MSEDVLDRPGAGRRALRGGTVRTAGYVAGMLLMAGSAPLLVRHLGLVDFGRYVTVASLVALVGGFSELGLNQVALRAYAAGDAAERRRVFPLLAGVRLLVGAAGAAVAVGFALAAGYDRTLLLGTAGAAAGMVVGGLQALFTQPLQGDLRLGALTAVELGRQVLSVAIIVALVLAGAGVLPFLLIQIPAGLAALAVTARLVRGRIPLAVSLDLRGAWGLVRETLALAAAVALSVAYFRIAIVVTSLVASEQQTGYFAASFRVVEVLIAFPSLLLGAAFPIIARAAAADADRFTAATRRMVELSVIAGVALATALVLGAPVVIDVLTGARPDAAVDALRIQSAALLPTFLAFAAAYALISLRRYRSLLVADSCALVAALAASLALVPAFGARGAALAALAAEVALAAANLALLRRAQPASVAPAPWLGAVVAAGGAIVAAGLLSGLPALAVAPLGVAALLAVLAALGRFPPELAGALHRA